MVVSNGLCGAVICQVLIGVQPGVLGLPASLRQPTVGSGREDARGMGRKDERETCLSAERDCLVGD